MESFNLFVAVNRPALWHKGHSNHK